MTDEPQEDVRAEMTRNGYVYSLGLDRWGHKVLDASMDGKSLLFKRNGEGIEAHLTQKETGNGVSQIRGMILGKNGQILEQYETKIVPKERAMDTTILLQSEIDFKYFKD